MKESGGDGRIRLHALPRHAPFQIVVTPRATQHRLPHGTLDLNREAWEITLPE